jgi:SAM-dependent methyltransferase
MGKWSKPPHQRDRTLESLTEQNRSAWETRSKLLGSSLKSVLFKGLPEVVNEHFHLWHRKLILKTVENGNRLRILDVGCGYGRLSMAVIERFPEADIIGVDISENYVSLYKKHTNRPAFVGAVENFPAELGIFDCIICVTVLMYVDDENLGGAINQLFLHLKPKGKLILIEPHYSGTHFQTVFGILPLFMKSFRRGIVNTGGRPFKGNRLEDLLRNAGGKILSENRIPGTSLCFFPMALFGIMLPKRVAQGIFNMISRLDDLLGMLELPSIFVAYVATRD